ncbi:SNARE domain containing protein [Tritrichomonas foetus]|uniref:SNARE domain containing protein n=1 Tax=Tritrichomonas foetus TaxID=1144522 RepID=A0A1J4JGV5_9EUKA|nr:SNARE domain containing protein [Tritrichomonas foetus]|eukprot:OHS98386.1 SNARE domain containing protein [Tritrichomonas foetus]
MYLPTNGANRDRTSILMSFRGNSVKARSSRETNDTTLLLSHADYSEPNESPLEPFFHLASEIKSELVRINTSFDTLLKKQHECLRPTFTDTSDSINEINALTASINSHLQAISQRINFIILPGNQYPDRTKILSNLRAALLESFREFSVKFKMAQQTFSASFNRNPHLKQKKKANAPFEFTSFNLGDEASERRQAQLQEERNNEEIEQIARRAEEIRNIFLDLSNLIVEQGTIIDRIDFNVSETLNNAVEAHKEVEKAAKYQSKSRMIYCAVILAIAVAVLVIFAILK